MSATVLRPLRLALAGLGFAALVYDLAHGLGETHWSAADFFSYFTILSNIFAVAMLLAAGLRRTPRAPAFELLRGACVLYILTTGIVYAVLLSGGHDSIPWTNTVLHRAMPIAIALDWLIDPPRPVPARLRAVLAWMAFPVLYIAYTLIRDPLAHWYPYFFVNPHHSGGYLWVAVNVLAIGIGQIAMSLAILALARVRAARLDTAVAVSRSG